MVARVAVARRQRPGNCHWSARMPAVRQQLVDAVRRVAVDAREQVTQVVPRLDAVELSRLHQSYDGGRALTGQLSAHDNQFFAPSLQGAI